MREVLLSHLALIALTARNADGTLRHGRQHLLVGQQRGDVLRQLQPPQPRVRQQRRVHHAFTQLADAALYRTIAIQSIKPHSALRTPHSARTNAPSLACLPCRRAACQADRAL